jgi:dihydroneopterin aldolase
MGLISLTGMEFFAYHGCNPEEQKKGNKFNVDLEFFTSTDEAEKNDDLSKTIDYQKVYDVIKREMDIKSKLLENVARRILNALFENFPALGSAKIVVSKLNPPLGGNVGKVSVALAMQF